MSNVIPFPVPSGNPFASPRAALAHPNAALSAAAHAPTLGDADGQWPWPSLGCWLPSGLPKGAVTLVRVPEGEPDALNAVVGDLIRATVDAGRPAVYALVNLAPNYLKVTEGLGAHIVLDQDVQASAVDGDSGVRHWYECGVPSLNVIPPRVADVEAESGPALLVLDGIQDARPYNLMPLEGETRHFGGVALDARGLNAWRAADVLTYASMREEAPTVVVWQGGPGSGNEAGYAGLVGVSNLVIDASSLPSTRRLLVSGRARLDQRLPYQSAVWR